MLHIKNFIQHILNLLLKKVTDSVVNINIKKLGLNTIYSRIALSVVPDVETTAMRLYSIHIPAYLNQFSFEEILWLSYENQNMPAFLIHHYILKCWIVVGLFRALSILFCAQVKLSERKWRPKYR